MEPPPGSGPAPHRGGRLIGFGLCLGSAAIIVTGVLFPGLWDVGDNDTNGVTVCLSFPIFYFGWVLAEGRKTPVIYLRHFGLTASNRMMSEAMTVLGSRYRIVTLDDFEIRPLLAPRLRTVLAVVGPLIAAVVLVLAAAYLNELRPVFFEWQRLMVILTVGPCAAMSSIHVWRVSRRSRLQVVTERDVMKIMRRVVELSHALRGSRLLEPQITVVRVSSSLWKVMLVSLFGYTDNVIVDVSVPTGNVLWELRLVPDLRRCVLVANERLLQGWLNAPVGPEEIAKLREKTRALLGDQDILLYDPEDRAHAREWQRRLRRVLDTKARRPRRAPTPRVPYLQARRRSVLTRVLVYAIVGIVWTYAVTASRWLEPLFAPIEKLAQSLARLSR